MSAYNHRPAIGDEVWDAYREKDNKNPIGRIIRILRYEDEKEIVVEFIGRGNYTYENGACIRSNGILYAAIELVCEPDWFRGETEIEIYPYDQLEDNWSSHDGGLGRYDIG